MSIQKRLSEKDPIYFCCKCIANVISSFGKHRTHIFALVACMVVNGPGHAKICLMSYANNKGADQPAHPLSLISTFVVRCLDSMMCILALSKVSRLWLVSVAEQAGLNLICRKSPGDTFSRDEAQIDYVRHIFAGACPASQCIG